MDALGRRRREWRKVPDRDLDGAWFLRHEHHYIFFRMLSSGDIGVITVLHESMDIPRRLREAGDWK